MTQNEPTFTVEVCYASREKQCILSVKVRAGDTIHQVIIASGILLLFPEINLEKQRVGVFSQIRPLTAVVKPKERIEIYRPLHLDPKEARRLKAKKIKK